MNLSAEIHSLNSWNTRQTVARQNLDSVPLPSPKDQRWRFSNTKLWNQIPEITRPGPLFDADITHTIAASQALNDTAARLIFHGEELINSEIMETGADILSLAEAWETFPNMMNRHFLNTGAPLGSDRFATLHEASIQNALVIRLPDGLKLTKPIEIWRWISGTSPHFPHLLVLAEPNSEATFLEHFISLDNEAGFVISMTDLVAQPSAKVRYAVAQRLNLQTRAVQITSTLAEQSASVTSLILNSGAKAVRQENLTMLRGESSESIMLSASLLNGTQEIDQRTYQQHDAPGAFSDLLYKNVLDDNTKSTFSGLIKVNEGAHRTDAYQKCRNLLLTEDCEANSMPGLEINADQVKCSHGATCGTVDDEQLFYFKSRGIPAETARRLIAAGFAEEAVLKFDDTSVSHWMAATIATTLD